MTSPHVTAAVEAVRKAAAVCKAVQADLLSAGTVTKQDNSPVTIADFAAQAVACSTLAKAFPGAGNIPGVRVVGEEDSKDLRAATPESQALLHQVARRANLSEPETLTAIDLGNFTPPPAPAAASAASPSTPTPPSSAYWTLDPIDGTKGFLRGEQYAVALAHLEAGTVTLGILGCPNLDGGLLLLAQKNQGVQRLSLHADAESRPGDEASGTSGTPLPRATTHQPIDQVRFCESVESGHSDQGASAAIATALNITAEPYRIDSQCKYAAVAMGHAHIYLRLPTKPGYREKIWDHAAGMLCVQEAGGTVTDVRGLPLDFTLGRQLENNRGIIATRGVDHSAVVAAVKGVLGEVV